MIPVGEGALQGVTSKSHPGTGRKQMYRLDLDPQQLRKIALANAVIELIVMMLCCSLSWECVYPKQ